MDYRKKYLKYKQKYLELKRYQTGGDGCFLTNNIIKKYDRIEVGDDGNCFYYCLEKAAELGLIGDTNKDKNHKYFRNKAYEL